jgi:nicotinamide-nucleotide amidase
VKALAERIGKRLLEKKQTLVTAESCTGGWVAQVVTSVPGSSAWFERGFVTYSNDAKQEALGVPRDVLRRHGAVSEETARAMALGALAHSRGTLALSITGVAGPAGGSAEKPVGTVCFGWVAKGREALTQTRLFEGDREGVRRQSVVHALEKVLELLDAG